MSKQSVDKSKADLPVGALMLECVKDRYKLPYAALRWAKEIKQKENLPDAIPVILPRAIRDILIGKVSIKEVEKLPFIFKVPSAPAPVQPTLTLNVAPEADEKKETKGKDKEKE
jgi:hypothetical protein